MKIVNQLLAPGCWPLALTKTFTTARRSRNQNPSPQRPQRAQRYAGKAKTCGSSLGAEIVVSREDFHSEYLFPPFLLFLRPSAPFASSAVEILVAVRGEAFDFVFERPHAFGTVKKNVEPFPMVLSTRTVPPWLSTMCFTIARPRPVPPVSRDRALSTR